MEITYLSLHCHHQNDFCIKMGSDESHFNVSLIVRDKVTRQSPHPWVLPTRKDYNYAVECCFASTETVGLLGTEAQDGHLDFHTAAEL